MVFNVAADLKAQGKLDAALPMVFNLVADLRDASSGELDALLPFVFNITANLTDATPAAPSADKLADPTIVRPTRRRLYAKQWNQFAETFDAFLRRQESLVRAVVQETEATATRNELYAQILELDDYSNDLVELSRQVYAENSELLSQYVSAETGTVDLVDFRALFEESMLELIQQSQDEQDIIALVTLIASAKFTTH